VDSQVSSGTPIDERLRNDLKVPIGRIVKDQDVSAAVLAPYFAESGLKVSVGDRTTERVHELGFSPDLEIIDYFEKRKPRSAPAMIGGEHRSVLHAVNPPGAISGESLRQLAVCLKSIEKSGSKIRLEISGEEDLLALPVVAFFPKNTITFYGQPDVGLVIVNSKEPHERAKRILEELNIRSLE
jgi:GTP-dependent dephospho-CoA kinase